MSYGLYTDHFLFSSKQYNNAPRYELSSAHKQQATFEYVFHVALGDPPLKKVILTYLVRISILFYFATLVLCI